ncbi:MAG: hypothetical protein VX752_08410, partial [Actinomycetota bacterium]|nr:hypothetical protein [Actinomycetota bacterium]
MESILSPARARTAETGTCREYGTHTDHRRRHLHPALRSRRRRIVNLALVANRFGFSWADAFAATA